MSLAPGSHLGAYEIVALIGAGGMGEVYRARDPRLGRDVAVKILPAGLSVDEDRLRRFEHEARAAAALNHPNILAVYDIGKHDGAPYIVSELLDGETLRERLSGGSLPVRKSTEYAIQIAHGLAAAHAKGIVHRDLKPENIYISDDGRVKILDFGLAKLTQTDGGADGITTPVQTQAGLLLGTLGYMAPEQLRGLTVDHRADVFAFGAVLYEMLSGRRAFRGETTVDTISAILKDDPQDLPIAERQIPPALARIIDRCLEKNAAARFHSMHDLAIALEVLSAHSESATAVAVPALSHSRSRAWIPWTLFAVAIAIGAWAYTRPTAVSPTYRVSLLPPEGVVVSDSAPSRLFALSPDGRRIAFVATRADRRRMIWVRSLDSLTAHQLTGTDGATAPFWSPDGTSLGFFAGMPGASGTSGGQLKKIDLGGGPPVTLCSFGGVAVGADWSPQDVILFSTTGAGSDGIIRRVPASGGEPTAVIAPDRTTAELGYWWPFFLPDGRHFLYLALGQSRAPLGIYVGSLDSGDRKPLVKGGSNAKYAQGHVLFLRGSTLTAQPFDIKRLELRGQAVAIAEGMEGVAPTGAFSVSQTGVLAYRVSDDPTGSQLTWFDALGKQVGVVGEPHSYGDLRLSPDGKRAIVSVMDTTRVTRDLWMMDLSRELPTRFTSDLADESVAVWSPDGSSVVFRADRSGFGDLYQKSSSGMGAETLLVADKTHKSPSSWSSDGNYIMYTSAAVRSWAESPRQTDSPFSQTAPNDLWILPMTGDRKPFPFLATRFNEGPGKFSPDGRWVAYVSNESGLSEVYVTSFPGATGKWRVSTSGGGNPVWQRDGKRLFYSSLDSGVIAVPVKTSAGSFEIGEAERLFEATAAGFRSFYDVTSDTRFLVNLQLERTGSAPITIMINWAEQLPNP